MQTFLENLYDSTSVCWGDRKPGRSKLECRSLKGALEDIISQRVFALIPGLHLWNSFHTTKEYFA